MGGKKAKHFRVSKSEILAVALGHECYMNIFVKFNVTT